MIRLVGLSEFNDKVTILNLDTNKKSEVNFYSLKDYTPLEPVGFMMFNRVGMKDVDGNMSDDVIVSVYRLLDVQMDINEPYAICRQSITDFFYTVICNEENNNYVGACVTRDNCPANIPYEIMAACDELYESVMVNFYKDDIVEDILNCIDTTPFDKALERLFKDHMNAKHGFYIESDSVVDDGWCKNLQTLLLVNNIITDLDSLRNITAVDFDLFEFMNKEDDGVYSFQPIMLDFFNSIFHINAVKTMVIEFGFDIDFAEFNNSNYTFIRDCNNKLFVVVYTVSGEYLEKDLEEEANKLGVADKLRLQFYNKWA